jgi:hypothetical protein
MPNMQDTQIKAMQYQIRFLWVVILLLIFGFIALAMRRNLFGTAFATGLSGTEKVVTLVSLKTGHRMVITGDGFQLFDKEGHSIVKLEGSTGEPQLTLTTWDTPWYKIPLSPNSKSPKLQQGPSLLLQPTTVEVFDGASESASIGIDAGPAVVLNGGNSNEQVSSGGFSIWNTCTQNSGVPVNPDTGIRMKDLPAIGQNCYQTHASLNTFLGLQIKTCKTYKGQPLDKANKDKGCESLTARSMPWGEQGAHISLSEDGQTRLSLGHTLLTSPRVGGEEKTPISQITEFDRNGKVIWESPQG